MINSSIPVTLIYSATFIKLQGTMTVLAAAIVSIACIQDVIHPSPWRRSWTTTAPLVGERNVAFVKTIIMTQRSVPIEPAKPTLMTLSL